MTDDKSTAHPLVFGEVLFDCFEDGSRVLGGAPFNVAWHLHAFGLDPLLVSRVGDDGGGREILSSMRRWGMDTSGIQHDPSHPTGEVRVTLCDGQPDFEIADDSAWDHIEPRPIANATMLYHGTLALRHQQTAQALDGLIRTHDAPVFIDVNLRRPWWRRDDVIALIDRARYVKINEFELDLVTGGRETARAAAESMLERHRLDRVIVTQGERGAFAIDRNQGFAEVRPDEAVRVVNAVGAGDAFASVCMVGLARDWPLGISLSRSQEFASLLVGQRGAVIQDPAIYHEVQQDWQ